MFFCFLVPYREKLLTPTGKIAWSTTHYFAEWEKAIKTSHRCNPTIFLRLVVGTYSRPTGRILLCSWLKFVRGAATAHGVSAFSAAQRHASYEGL
jgi:hypothetical protein